MLLDRDKSLIDNSRACISNRCALFFFVYCPEYYSGFLINYAQYTHYSRTIDGQYTHNKRTIPNTSSEDEDTIPAFTPYTRKIAQNAIFLAYPQILLYLCARILKLTIRQTGRKMNGHPGKKKRENEKRAEICQDARLRE